MSHFAGQLLLHFAFPLDQNRRPFVRCDAGQVGEEANEMAQRVYKTLLKPGPDDARAQLEELALRLEPGEYAARGAAARGRGRTGRPRPGGDRRRLPGRVTGARGGARVGPAG